MNIRLGELQKTVKVEDVHDELWNVVSELSNLVMDSADEYIASGRKPDLKGFRKDMSESLTDYFQDFWENVLSFAEDDR